MSTNSILRSLHSLERSAHGALGIILMGVWMAEIGNDAVVMLLGYCAAEFADGFVNARPEDAHDASNILRIKSNREFRRVEHAAYHHRKLPALSLKHW